jgi:4'-phosphopantetheinyl transferase
MRATVASVELHAVDLRAEGQPWETWVSDLAPKERARADRFAFPEGRRRFIVGRATLRRLLADRLQILPADISLIEGPQGKPALDPALSKRNKLASSIGFNLSHSGDMAVIAIGSGELGIDVESVHRSVDAMAIVRRFFSETERAGFEAMEPGVVRDRLFFRVWTRKEALVKAVGRGLSCPLSSFTVPLGDLSTEGEWLNCPEQPGRKWRLHEVGNALNLGPDWVSALVAAA